MEENTIGRHGEVKVNVDTILITLKEGELHVALAPRTAEHEKGRLALIGAIMDGNLDADLDAVVVRSLREKAGLSNVYFEQLYTFSGRNNKAGKARDSRWPSVSVSYIALVPLSRLTDENSKTHHLEIVPIGSVPELPFDHNDMIEAAVMRLRGKGAWSVLPAYLLEDEFTLPQLNLVYQQVVGNSSLGQNFRRKVIEADMLVSTGFKSTPGATKKAEHFKIKPGVSTIDTKL